MTNTQRTLIASFRANGMGYGTIAKKLEIPVNTVKSFCRRKAAKPKRGKLNDGTHQCLCCGKPVMQNPGRREKKFCSDACRRKWWNGHTGLMKENAVCARCGKPFHGRAGRKYCCHACYIADRFGDDHVS